MPNEQILKKAIEKAVENGWDPTLYRDVFDNWVGDGLDDEYYIIIFSHSFAKAFWGEEKIHDDKFVMIEGMQTAWKYHLQQMVLEEQPLKYIEKWL